MTDKYKYLFLKTSLLLKVFLFTMSLKIREIVGTFIHKIYTIYVISF